MRFLVVTPSLHQLVFLRRCLNSVADQADKAKCVASVAECLARVNISVHHHVQDAVSKDGTDELLKTEAQKWFTMGRGPESESGVYSFSYASEADEGMYDAIAKGWNRATEDTDIVSWLNCDEQYLPDALERVCGFFREHPDVDVVFGDVIIADAKGNYVCSRRMTPASRSLILSDHLPYFTASMFIRREACEKYQLYPDKCWKNIGDVELVLRMLRQRLHFGFLKEYTSVFCETGKNLGLDRAAMEEYMQLRAAVPLWIIRLRYLWVLLYRLKKLFCGGYHLCPFEYSLYVDHSDARRKVVVSKPESRWLSRLGNK
jgi:glycosyltransferase involved in cell wall biosynthesis